MRAGVQPGPCDSGFEVGDDELCVQTCNQGQVLDTGSGICVECGGDGEPLCPDGTFLSAVLCSCSRCFNIVLLAVVLAYS